MPETDNRWSPSAKRIRLGGIVIDLRYRTVSHDDVVAELHPRCFDLLLMFLRERGTLQTREAIFRKVWPGVVIEDATLTSSIWVLRRAIGMQNKHWIRTVAKQGYVFDPPADLPILEDPPREPVDGTVEPVAGPVAGPAPDAASARRHGWLAAGILIALVLAGVLHYALSSRPSRRVELLWTTPGETAWPAQVLDGWIGWQLRSFADIDVIDAGEICDGCSSLVTLMSIERTDTGTAGLWRVSIRFRGENAPADIVRESSDEHLIDVLDDVARSTIAELVPASRDLPLPRLKLDRAAAELWVQGLAAERAQRWGEAAGFYTRLLDRSPEFGYARMQLARCLMESRRTSQAVEATGKLAEWIETLPAALKPPLLADTLFVRQDYAAAATAYAALAQQHEAARAGYRIAEARSLRLDGRTVDAAQRLAGDMPRSRELALRWLQERAETEMANRDVARVVESATEAGVIADGLGMTQAAARATLLRAEALAALAKPLEAREFDQAAAVLEQGGNTLEALRALAYEELLSAAPSGPGKHTDAYIANARMAGNGSLEIDALRRVAQFRFRSGDAAGAHTAYMHAGDVAKSTIGSRRDQQLVELDLLQDDTLRLAFASIDSRLAALRAQPLQGRIAVLTGQSAARMAYWRGDFASALAILDETSKRYGTTATGSLAQVTSTLGCLRAAIHMARGETALARNADSDCRASGMPLNRHLADITDAELAIGVGDLEQARRLIAPMLAGLSEEKNQVFRLAEIQEVAPLAARIGDLQTAAKFLDDALPSARETGYTSFEADMRITRAEIAMALAEPDRAARELARAEAILPKDYWYDMQRWQTARAVQLHLQGDRSGAAEQIGRVHAAAVEYGDVIAELRIHSLLDPAHLDTLCSRSRHLRLIVSSGMRGATNAWMLGGGSPIGLPPRP